MLSTDCSKDSLNPNSRNVVNVTSPFLSYTYHLKKGVFRICGKALFLNAHVYKRAYILRENTSKRYYTLSIISFVCAKSKPQLLPYFIFRAFFFTFTF